MYYIKIKVKPLIFKELTTGALIFKILYCVWDVKCLLFTKYKVVL